jgi:SAM-dependent methyltransferase
LIQAIPPVLFLTASQLGNNMKMLSRFSLVPIVLLAVTVPFGTAFITRGIVHQPSSASSSSALQMGLDVVTYLRTEWISAALVTNQTPRSADVCLQLGTQDGRAVQFVPRTIREIITSTITADGILPVSTRRQLKQQKDRRSGSATISYLDQRADDLKQTARNSVDVVISLQSAAPMMENGLDWKQSIREAARVLKAGGRFIFVEQTKVDGEEYLDFVGNVRPPREIKAAEDDDDFNYAPTFELVGFDDVDLVLEPHVAGVFVKSEMAGMSITEATKKEANKEKERIDDLSIAAYERGIKKRKRKQKPGKESG